MKAGNDEPAFVSLVQSNHTRWHLLHDALARALELRDQIEMCVNHYTREKKEKTIILELSDEDWDDLAGLLEVSQLLVDITRKLEGDDLRGRLWAVMPAFISVDTHLKAMAKKYSKQLELLYLIKLAQTKFARDHDLPQMNYALFATTILHPEYKLTFF